ncbi:MAG: aminotransferase class V-fold PLP-dependent enzyme, partial [Bdellovibrionota bacterium]
MRRQFPILASRVRGGKPLVYLDSAATTQKPESVLAAMDRYYRESNANIHRGVHYLSEKATLEFETARKRVARFFGATDPRGVVFTRGTTESINLVAGSLRNAGKLGRGDCVVLSQMEHHSNIVPWQLLCEATGAQLKVVPITQAGELDLDAYRAFLAAGNVRIVAVTHVSNALGTVNPVQEIVALARKNGALTLVDGAQAVLHMPVDFAPLDCDFYAFSGHKIYGPTGVGVLLARPSVLEKLPPWQGGGDMIHTVTFEKST